ncbi:hypothetical protein [Streptomyces sp. CCNWLW230]|uniref:hypothetical protein n=1 Tax=unclassified Streptomyces TaxID=2593676 RepID=UPI003FD10227
MNVQVIVDAEIRLVVATARPVPGNTADAKAWRNSGLAAHREGLTALGDGCFPGLHEQWTAPVAKAAS